MHYGGAMVRDSLQAREIFWFLFGGVQQHQRASCKATSSPSLRQCPTRVLRRPPRTASALPGDPMVATKSEQLFRDTHKWPLPASRPHLLAHVTSGGRLEDCGSARGRSDSGQGVGEVEANGQLDPVRDASSVIGGRKSQRRDVIPSQPRSPRPPAGLTGFLAEPAPARWPQRGFESSRPQTPRARAAGLSRGTASACPAPAW
jgi:hypothetical protein